MTKHSLSLMIASKVRLYLETAGLNVMVDAFQPSSYVASPFLDGNNDVVEVTYEDGEKCPFYVEVADDGASINERVRDAAGQMRVLQGRYRIADIYKQLVSEMVDKALEHAPAAGMHFGPSH